MFFSIVVPVNDFEIYRNFTAALARQNFKDYELIVIDSVNNRYQSAAEAFRTIRSRLQGEYIIFSHQDIVFPDECFLDRLTEYCDKYRFGIAGLAGKVKLGDKYDIMSKIRHMADKRPAGNDNFAIPLATENLDECFLIIPRKVFEQRQFGDFAATWHLYATEYCLQMAELGERCLVLPLTLWHNCKEGSLNKEYYEAIIRLCRKYKSRRYITTLYGIWPTNALLCRMKCIYRIRKLV